MRNLWLLLPILGCSEYDLKSREDGEGGSGPDVAVDPSSVNFGTVDLGESSVAKVVTVSNVGRGDLHLDPLTLDAVDGTFEITALGASTLASGESADFSVVFTPIFEGEATGAVWVLSDDADEPALPVSLVGDSPLLPHPDIELAPATTDFGTLDPFTTATAEIVLSNRGDADLTVSGYLYSAGTSEMDLQDPEATWGPPPWVLAPGESRSLFVDYAPQDAVADTGTLTVYSDDPDEPEVAAVQLGNGPDPSSFATRWYVYDDGLAWETTSSPTYVVDSHGDADLYWYEPSGAHGLVDSVDPAADFVILSDYVRLYGAITDPVGPFSFESSSTLSTFQYANFTYVLCDFYLPSDADPSTYTISSGTVDDGIQVMVNGEILGRLALGDSGEWVLDNAVPGSMNTLVVILVDDSAANRYMRDLAFTHDGVMVE